MAHAVEFRSLSKSKPPESLIRKLKRDPKVNNPYALSNAIIKKRRGSDGSSTRGDIGIIYRNGCVVRGFDGSNGSMRWMKSTTR